MGILYENGIWAFVIVTLLLGGGAAYKTGEAQAKGWKPAWMLVPYVILLTGAVRFIHFALYNGELLSLYYYLLNFAILLGISFLAFRIRRAEYMVKQYPFAYERSGVLGWKEKS